MKDQVGLEDTHHKEALLDELFRRSHNESTLFGYYLGEAAVLAGAMDLFEQGLSKVPLDKQDDYIKGIAHAVAYKDLGVFGVMALRDENIKQRAESQSSLAYEYIKGVLVFKGLIKE